VTLRPAGR